MRVLALLLCLAWGDAFYLPGVAPREYVNSENVTVKVNSIKSVETAVPYDFYSIMVCRPTETKVPAEAENMGEILWGDSIKPSLYHMQMQKDISCSKICSTRPKPVVKKEGEPEPKPGPSKSLKKLKKRIDDEYRGHFILDNLPVSEVTAWPSGDGLFYRRGYPLGTPAKDDSPTTVNNHLAFTVKMHKPDGLVGWRIVGFEVVPHSIISSKIDSECSPSKDFDFAGSQPQTVIAKPPAKATKHISWSYSVRWVEDTEVAWVSRWDHYLKSSDASNSNIHWFAIVTSLMVVLFLTALVAMILMRALHHDFNRYNNPDNEDEAQEEIGWKVVHGDVFREPSNAGLLSCYVGTGCQLLGMAAVILLFACLGFLSPARRGGLMTAMLVLYAIMGSLGGFVAAVLSKMFHEQSWKTIFLTGVWFPGKIFAVFFCLNLMLWYKQAANAIPFVMLLGLVGLWFFVCVPLVFLGGSAGYKTPTIEAPQSVSSIQRFIPDQRWYMQSYVMVLAGGAVPFGAAFVELYFILSSLWLNKVYYVFGFFAVVFVILMVTCAEISIVLVYFQLCYEDPRWWWRSFLYAGSSGLYLFLYSIQYFTSTLNMTSFASMAIYFGYMGVLSYGLFIITGTIGFLSSLLFVRYIYASLKVD